ncbi:2',3'-cyclic-nucleotide 2'-phosphodiesterase / 3'-nucleotidase [Selenomonas ruminantium]|uniref:2',3'-cyclic-nucleotide 2'-phosphodiesterase / 3'-nucleotidase n=1 Tax=Selenomonas ruminantium TaxID=971 RepID=A0A1M6URZ7_SELRU|nr:5'-nucleotidase C-terminal domain-containing protein [Selenomonas ruminantium]SHK71960.1 2',3'-cyclic-nucleotide 2'-phosphodiesterase / 3'-nucleotidase [Selenomonas ruminantium]
MLSRRNFLQLLLAGGVTAAVEGISGVKALASAGDTVQLTILGTSDVHGRFMPWDYATDTEDRSGSLVQLYTAIKQIRQETPNVILVDCGDSIQDNSVEQFNTKPHQPMIVAMNEMNYDTWTMGNHEFNFGLDVLKHVTDQFKGKNLCGNVYYEDGRRYLPASAIVEKAGIKIGIIGLNTPMIAEFEKDTDHLKGVTVTNPTTETRKIIEELKGKADILIGVMHMGLENENNHPDTSVTDVAKANPELTAIVAGHMHKNVSSATVNGVLISEPYKYGQALTRIDLTLSRKDNRWEVTEKKAQTIPMKNYDSDGKLVEILAPFHLEARKTANEEIGTVTGMNMVPEDTIPGISEVQVADTPLTNFFNEVQLHYSGADVTSVMISRDNAQMAAGPVRRKDIAFNYQYTGGETTVYEITGKDLRTYMEWSAAYFNQKQPGDIAPSYNPVRRASKYSTNDIFGGVNYVIDLTEPAGSRIKDLRLKRTGKRIKDTDKIKLGMNAYRMNQLTAKDGIFAGQQFPQIWTSLEAFGENEGTIRNMSIRYIKEVKNGVLAVKPVNDWHISGFDRKNASYQKAAQLLRAGKITLHNSADGKYTNIASLNEQDISQL